MASATRGGGNGRRGGGAGAGVKFGHSKSRLEEIISMCNNGMLQTSLVDESVDLMPSYIESRDDKALLAVALVRKVDDDMLQLDRLFVPKQHRRKGYARSLLQEVLKMGDKFRLQVDHRNRGAILLYQSCGFSVGKLRNVHFDMERDGQNLEVPEKVWCYCQKPDDARVYVQCSGEDLCPYGGWVHQACSKEPITKGAFWCKACKLVANGKE